MDCLRLPSVLESSQSILIAGAGGGFDVHSGLPIYERLRSLGKRVFLANLSFTYLGGTNARALTPALFAIDTSTTVRSGTFRSERSQVSSRGVVKT